MTETKAPSIESCLTSHEKDNYATILNLLDKKGISYNKSHRLVRGLDYYSDFIFEWISSDLGAQSTICGGGRYDPLVQSMGHDIPAIGFAAGIDRIAEVTKPLSVNKLFIYVYSEDPLLIEDFMLRIESIRHAGATINIDYTPGKIKSKINAANALNYNYLAILQPKGIKRISLSSDTSILMTQAEFNHWYTSLHTGA